MDQSGDNPAGKSKQSGANLGEKEQVAARDQLGQLHHWETLTLSGAEKLTKLLTRLAARYSEVSIPQQIFSNLELFDPTALEFYCSKQFFKSPKQFFRSPRVAPKISFSDTWNLSLGEIKSISFKSTFRPTFPGCRIDDANCVGGRTVSMRYWQHPPGTALGTIIAVHGWQMADPRLTAVSLAPGFFFKMGLNVVVFEMPYHGSRQQYSQGEPVLFPSSDLARTTEGFAQAIFELRQIRLWLKETTDKPVGVVGLSLGGYVAALWSALDALDFSICISPVVDLIEFAREYVSTGEFDNAEKKAVLEFLHGDSLKEAFSVHCPLSYEAKVPDSGRLLLAAKDDQVVPAEQVLRLWDHWGRPRLRWLSGGHFGQMFADDAMRHVHSFLSGLGVALHVPIQISAAPL